MLQKGFDEGFTTCLPFARAVGSLRGMTASLLVLLTTTAGAKHLLKSPLAQVGQEADKTRIIELARSLFADLASLTEESTVPVDLEALEHAKLHDGGGADGEGDSEKKEMSSLADAFQSLSGRAVQQKHTIEGCRERLEQLLKAAGLEDVLRV